MRDLLLMPIFFGVVVMALRQPWIGVILFAWISVMNPHRLTYGFAYDMPLALIAAGVTVFGIVFGKQRFRFPLTAPTITLILFIAWMGLTTLTAIHPESSFDLFVRALKTLFMVLVATAVIQDRQHIHVLLWTLVLSLAFYGVKGGLFTIASGGGSRVWGPPDSLVNGNNEIAVAFAMIIPLMYYLGTTFHNAWYRRAMYVAIFLTTVAALGTQSRGALLAVMAMSAMLWLKSPHKWRLALGALILGLVIFAFMPESWWERMATIGTYKEDGSAMGRVNAWQMAVNIALDRVMGAGFDAWTPFTYELYSPIRDRVPLVAHSIYFHVLGDHGFVGLALFLTFWFVTYWCAGSVRRDTESVEELSWARDMSRMIQVGLVGYFVGGAFLSLAYWDVPYFLMVLVVALRRYVTEAKPALVAARDLGRNRPSSTDARQSGA